MVSIITVFPVQCRIRVYRLVSVVVVNFFFFQSLFYIYFFQKLKVKNSATVLEMVDPMVMPFAVWKNWLL